ncbi:MAG: amino acid ABC transporter ATP-binding protein [Chthoniobacterales bacterium]
MKLELQGVTKRFGAQTIVENLSATLEFSHTLVLVGPSGGGKSTLLRLLAGLIAPDAGKILFDGAAVPTDESSLLAYRAKLGIVFQAFNLFPHLSALDNICLPLTEVHGLSRPAATTQALSMLERFRLAEHAHKRPTALSGGQCQRVAIARALAIQPRALFLDEPTSALDPEMTAEVLDFLAELRGDGCPQILVTHAMGFARHTADLVAFVAGGKLIEVRPPAEFFAQPAHPEAQRFLERVLRY